MPEKTSIWKKEIHLRRPGPAVVAEHAHEPTVLEPRTEWPTPRRPEVWPAAPQGELPTALETPPTPRAEVTTAEVNAAVAEVREKLAERLDAARGQASPAAAEP